MSSRSAHTIEPTARFLCPRCGQVSPFKMRCPECGVPMADADALPPWGIHGLSHEWTLPPRWGYVVSLGALCGLGGVLAGLALTSNTSLRVGAFLLLVLIDAVLLIQVSPRADWRAGSLRETARVVWAAFIAAMIVVTGVASLGDQPIVGGSVFGCLGMGLGILLTYMNSVRLTRREGCDPDESTFAAASPTSIHNAPPGQVRVSGRVRVTRFACRPDGDLCAAYEQRIGAGRAVSIHTGGGVLELDDGSGTSARVLGEWVRVLDGSGLNALAVLADGAEVEVVGEGRWITVGSAGAPLRGGLRVLEITGSQERPVLLRTLRRPAEPASGVRIATTPTASDAGAEPERGAADGAAREVARRSEEVES